MWVVLGGGADKQGTFARFARFARSVFQPMLRVTPRISSFPPEVKTFDEYSSSLDSFMSLSTYRIEELRGSVLVVFSPAFTADCLETIIEIGDEYKELFIEAGGENLDFVPSLNYSDKWANAIIKIINKEDINV